MTKTRIRRLEEVASHRTRSLTVVLDGVHDPHNFSAVLRSCEAFGILNLHVIESAGPFQINPLITQGAEKWVNIDYYSAPDACVNILASQGFRLWIANPSDRSIEVDALPWEDNIALVFGNEHRGVSATMMEASKGAFHIPMYGFSQSFNISVSAAISLAIAVRHREKRSQGHGDLSPEEQKALIADYQRRSVRKGPQILSRLENNK